MKYVGIQTQIHRNNMMSMILLVMFPLIIMAMVWCFLALLNYFGSGYYDEFGNVVHELDPDTVNYYFITTLPWIVGVVSLWFIIAYFFNARMVERATGAKPLARRDNPRVYNIVENLCLTAGMEMPQINIVNDPQLNAFASGINSKSYAVTLTTGIIDRLSDEELAGVIGHELTHIRNRDTRLLITSIIFVGIVSTVMSLTVRMMYDMFYYGGSNVRIGSSKSNNNNDNSGLSVVLILFVALICSAIAYFFTLITRFAISRSREYMADAGGAELTGNPQALANALRKIALDPGMDSVNREDIAQMFIMHPDEMSTGILGFMDSLFSTHPDPQKRIAYLEQY